MSPENPSARPAVPVGEFDRKHLAPAFPVNPDRDQDRVAGNDAILPNPLIARVQDQIGEWLLELAFAERLQRCIQPLVDRAEAEKACPTNSSVTCFTFRVETPCTYISASAATNAFSER